MVGMGELIEITNVETVGLADIWLRIECSQHNRNNY